MNEIEIIITGFNKEKEILVTKLCQLENSTYDSTKIKRDSLNDRLSIVDKKIDEIINKLIKTTSL